ncbi:MAG: hypothetical protein A2087_11895 [Spirochaetes bacterium GWD1_61_31]|nr:MAG: hypothetical protein A2Y37_07015 [Spirochaetes bacterium GWB1_60_80]OHD30823.1 MAG: hypothetical protein A2004_04540 [Spirochaetes bacterium GWC1_61_12]OHD37374.1 MAG: hypothetical protein A2087_11895 [Spirochaetes bacterium GWD1_61_31]OHD46323.1 MAG: hypothetical protein A2Y35_07290 [Spirochaetes bacterium GWE1_60_18]OHD60930.1 MAG: hypothetical protein A2Y32_12035 [Spirochaetes bacterium GWF1_60_12]HAP42812.1 hypothetical protein [Spirochaetaceae bacterium]
MLHEPAVQAGKDPAFPFKRKLGVRLFCVYALVYAAFIAINVIKPQIMETIVLGGLNLAVIYGFGLILFALILALIYSSICSRRERSLAESKGA